MLPASRWDFVDDGSRLSSWLLGEHGPRSVEETAARQWSEAITGNYCRYVGQFDTSVSHFLGQSRYTAGTREVYGGHLRLFHDWCAQNGYDFLTIEPSTVQEYLDQLRRGGAKASTVRNKWHSLVRYYSWLEANGAVPANPAESLRPERSDEAGPPTGIPLTDLRRLLAAAGSERNWALIATLAFTALRVSELLARDRSSVVLTPDGARLNFAPDSNRGYRLPYVALPRELAEALVSQSGDDRRGPLFRQGGGKRMTRGTAAEIVKAAGRRAGLGYRVTPQMLTYTLALTALDAGFSYSSVLRAMGTLQPRNGQRLLPHAEVAKGIDATIRLARLVLHPADDVVSMLEHVTVLLTETDLPEPFAIMAAGSLLERHMRLLCEEHGFPVKAPDKNPTIQVYLHALYRGGLLNLTDMRALDIVADRRNDASHGRFEAIPAGAGAAVLRSVRDFIGAHPVPEPVP